MFNTVRDLFTKHIYTRKDFPKWNFKSQSNTDLQLTILLSTRDSGNRSTLRYMSFLAVLHVIQNVSNCKICKQNVSHFCLSDWVINPLSPHFQTYQAVKEGAKVYNKSDSKATRGFVEKFTKWHYFAEIPSSSLWKCQKRLHSRGRVSRERWVLACGSFTCFNIWKLFPCRHWLMPGECSDCGNWQS